MELGYTTTTTPREVEPLHNILKQQRISGSSFTFSTSGTLSDVASLDDFPSVPSETQSFSSDAQVPEPPPPSNNTSDKHYQRTISPSRPARQDLSIFVRDRSRTRVSPSPATIARSVPYSMDSSRSKRWSAGSCGNPAYSQPMPPQYGLDAGYSHSMAPYDASTMATSGMPMNMNQFSSSPHQSMLGSSPTNMSPQGNMFMTGQMNMPPSSQPFMSHGQPRHFEPPAPLMSNGSFRMLHSNADPHSLHGRYTSLSDAPDLFAPLFEEQIPPPEEDMNPSDPDMIPREQELRFEGDLYTPKWVRGSGNKREGWCGICKPGRWLVLKNSAYWYDKSFSHGVSASNGAPLGEPESTRRMEGNPEVWEGLCGSCNEWIALVSSKKKGTTWFRHAYKVGFGKRKRASPCFIVPKC